MADKARFDRLRLAARGDAARLHEILNLEMRGRHASKLADTLGRYPDFEFPDSLSGEQATADDIARLHAGLVAPGERVLDMTCGLGIDAFHLARRAASVTACELDPARAAAARRNAAGLGLGNLTVVEADSVRWLEADGSRRFDTIFIDPARRDASGGRVYALADCVPDVTRLLPLLRERCRRLVVKASPMLDVSRLMAELGGGVDVVVTGTPAECKELVAVVPGTGQITAATTGFAPFTFDRAREHDAEPPYGIPAPGDTLHEPFPAAMKSGALKLMATLNSLTKIAPDTHLYHGPSAPSFPGRRHKVVAVMPLDKRGLRQMRSLVAGTAEVAARNLGMPAAELCKRLGITREAGPLRVYGVRDASGRRLLILTEK